MILLNTTENDHKIQFDLFWPEILLYLWCLSYDHKSILQKEKQIPWSIPWLHKCKLGYSQKDIDSGFAFKVGC